MRRDVYGFFQCTGRNGQCIARAQARVRHRQVLVLRFPVSKAVGSKFECYNASSEFETCYLPPVVVPHASSTQSGRSSTRKDEYDRSHSKSNNTTRPTMIITPDDQASKGPSDSKVQPEELVRPNGLLRLPPLLASPSRFSHLQDQTDHLSLSLQRTRRRQRRIRHRSMHTYPAVHVTSSGRERNRTRSQEFMSVV